MDFDMALDIGRNAFHLALLTSAPILAMGLVVGLAISIFQAVTQLQEQTLSFVPKIAAMVLAASLFIPWIGTRMLDYCREMFGTLP
ncbi:MAG: flagellar biosynthesis protein FliQ [Phycisphaerae bacterium]|nr:flagellar biosynthesis protein FliQ [Phycisphaerae bacterium]